MINYEFIDVALNVDIVIAARVNSLIRDGYTISTTFPRPDLNANKGMFVLEKVITEEKKPKTKPVSPKDNKLLGGVTLLPGVSIYPQLQRVVRDYYNKNGDFPFRRLYIDSVMFSRLVKEFRNIWCELSNVVPASIEDSYGGGALLSFLCCDVTIEVISLPSLQSPVFSIQ